MLNMNTGGGGERWSDWDVLEVALPRICYWVRCMKTVGLVVLILAMRKIRRAVDLG